MLSFRFGGKAQVINPRLVATVIDAADTCNGVRIDLQATLGITPIVFAEVVRNTLIILQGAELADDCGCGMDGFDLYAGSGCCDPAPTPAPARNASGGVLRSCGCGRNGQNNG